MEIKLWQNFSKRVNSTKQPSADAAITKSAVLKSPTSIEAPTFTITGNDYTYNYAQAFGHYYYIADIIQNTNGTCDLVCTQDVMATYKSNIGSYSGFMEYSSSSTKINITDVRNNPTQNWNGAYTPVSITNSPFNANGVYVIGVLNDSGNGALGSVCYYYLNTSEMSNFQRTMFNHDFITNLVTEFTGSASSLVSCVWLPLSVTAIGNMCGASTNVKVGSFTMDASIAGVSVVGYPVTSRILSVARTDVSVAFPSSVTYGITARNYLDRAPYSTGVLYLPFVGCVPLDLDVVALNRTFAIDAKIDIISGDIVYGLYTNAGQIQAKFATYSGNIATHMPLSAASYDSLGVITGGISTIGGVAGSIIGAVASGASGNVAGVAASVVGGSVAATQGALSTARSFELHTMVNGAASSAISASFGFIPTVMIFTAEPSETNLTAFQSQHGMPVFEIATIGSQSGYVKMRDASIPIAGLEGDRAAVNAYVNGGFYYE